MTLPGVDQGTNRFNLNQGYGYDANGNIIQDVDPATGHTRQFAFNGDNKQTLVIDTTVGQVKGTYFYDGDGRRVKKVTTDETTVFVYDGLGKLAAEYSTAQPPTSPTTHYTATDTLGSPRVITNGSGQVESRRDFMPFGEELFADGTYRTTAAKYSTTGQDAVRQRFTGYQRDAETSLDFAEARYYQNAHGRFTAVDPLLASGKSANPQTFNRYVYGLNNPVVLSDPTGLQAATQLAPCKSGESGCDWKINGDGSVSPNGLIAAVEGTVDAVANWAKTQTETFFAQLSSSDPLQNANGTRFQSVMNLTTGLDDGVSSDKLLGFMGPSNFSILQQTTDSFKAAQTIGETNLLFQGFYGAFAPGFAGGSNPIATNGGTREAKTGGMNLFKFGSPQAENPDGWKTGDYFLNLPDRGIPKLNWAQNYGALRGEMSTSRAIFDSYRTSNGQLIPARSGSFLNAERYVLMTRGWIYSVQTGAWLPPH